MKPVRHLTYRNGTTAAYVLAVGNSFLQLLFAFGVNITPQENVAISAFTNAVWMLGVRLVSMPYTNEPGKVTRTPGTPATLTVEPPVVPEPPVAPPAL